MKLLTFSESGGTPRVGALLDKSTIIDLEAAAGENGGCFRSMMDLINSGSSGIVHARGLLEEAQHGRLPSALKSMAKITLMAPIPRPAKNIFCVGRNYVDHVKEGYNARGLEIKLPEHPQFFTKPCTAVIACGDTIPRHGDITEKLDYEVELAVIVGKRGRDIAPENWREYVFGYTILNDVTARDLQRRHDQWFKGKSLDGTCPMGPWIVTDDEIANPQSLKLSLEVNGEGRQSANTAQMIFDLPRIFADLSRGMTLDAGDIIATGTPSGVGYAMTPPRLLESGDVVTCHVEGIGTLENRVL
jgi:2-keto-4-pentenoate hydratase/2-oxohepta-3-ene-1,7-dioic acid hydratase in catechol pathway